jgi:hypothetical protein
LNFRACWSFTRSLRARASACSLITCRRRPSEAACRRGFAADAGLLSRKASEVQ